MSLQEIVREANSLTLEERKQLIKLLVDTFTEKEATSSPKKRSILEFAGVGAEMWEGIDAQEYVNQNRNECDHCP